MSRVTAEERLVDRIEERLTDSPRRCSRCRDDVSGENMWRCQIVVAGSPTEEWLWLCKADACAPSRESAFEYFAIAIRST